MSMDTAMTHHFDVLIVGAGPAGLAAASAAAQSGRSVAVLDDNHRPGGQIWRTGHRDSQHKPEPAKRRALEAFNRSGAQLFSGRQVVDARDSGVLRAWMDETQTLETFTCDKLILATGARERFLPFPGWTLPGVFGAGGLQALVRGGYDVRGKRVIVAGTGPLLLAVAAHLKQDGARIATIVEQASTSSLAAFSTSLLRFPGKLAQAIQLKLALLGIPHRTGCWPVAAEGSDYITAVRLTDGKRTWTEPCDLLACGFHLVPNTELASLLGCRLDGDFVLVDQDQQTSIPGVYCAGEPTGIAGVDSAILQGRIAGLAAAGNLHAAAQLHRRRDAEAVIGKAMDRAFALRPELLTLAQPDTIICRCEDVPLRDLQAQAGDHSQWTGTKLQTRCGMGPCQGRICGPAVKALFGWQNTSVRPPLFPVPLSAFCANVPTDEQAVEEPA